MMENNENFDGIFILNGQIFSINTLMELMQRHGIRISINRDGLVVDGEQITALLNFNENSCPLSSSCDKRSALMEFLKLQKKNNSQGYQLNRNSETYSNELSQNSRINYRLNEPSRNFIKPNNHDLFEGNINNPNTHQQNKEETNKDLFSETDLFSKTEEPYFEEGFFDDDFQIKKSSREKTLDEGNFNAQSESDHTYCKKCGYDLKVAWNSCPNCGQKVISNGSETLFY